MTMTNEEILKSFREAKAPLKQIAILADLNTCKKSDIRRILMEQGVPEKDLHAANWGEKKVTPLADESTQPAAEMVVEDEVSQKPVEEKRSFDAIYFLTKRSLELANEIEAMKARKEALEYAIRELRAEAMRGAEDDV